MNALMEELPHRHRITVDEYYRMGEAGLLSEDARVELIEGEIYDMPTMGPLHGAEVAVLNQLLVRAVGDHAIVRCQLPTRLDEYSEPVPDFSVVRPREDFYAARHPTAADTFLIIEVSDTSRRFDLGVKVPRYARHLVPEVWIVDLVERELHLFRSPADGTYADAASTTGPITTFLAALPHVSVDLAQLLRRGADAKA